MNAGYAGYPVHVALDCNTRDVDRVPPDATLRNELTDALKAASVARNHLNDIAREFRIGIPGSDGVKAEHAGPPPVAEIVGELRAVLDYNAGLAGEIRHRIGG